MKTLALVALSVGLLAGCGRSGLTTAATATDSMSAQSKIDPQAKVLLTRLDNNKDGKLALAEFQQLGIFGVNGVGGGPNNPNPSLSELQEMTFEPLDRNHDGKLAASEFNAFGVAVTKALYFPSPNAFYTTVFPRLDSDKDSKLTLTEYQQLGIFGVNGIGGGPGNANPSLSELQEMTFKLFDQTNDGVLTLDELVR